jgi:hypothetical protein
VPGDVRDHVGGHAPVHEHVGLLAAPEGQVEEEHARPEGVLGARLGHGEAVVGGGEDVAQVAVEPDPAEGVLVVDLQLGEGKATELHRLRS